MLHVSARKGHHHALHKYENLKRQ